jgi:ABC-type multidrug transport system permease subunit
LEIKKPLGVVPDISNLYDELSARENLLFMARLYGVSKALREQRAEDLLQAFEELVPGLIAMTILFATTAAEAVVINFELRIGSLERPLLAPVSAESVLLAKVLGGFAFGALMTLVVVAGCIISLDLHINYLGLFLTSTLSLLVFSSMGAFASVSVKEVFEAHTLLNIPRSIMIFLCGVVYPMSAMPAACRRWQSFCPSPTP